MLSRDEKEAIQNSSNAHTNNKTANVPQNGVNFNGMVFRQGKSSEFGHSYLVGVLSQDLRKNVGRVTSKETSAARESDFFPNGIAFQSRKKGCDAEDIYVGPNTVMMVGGNKECTMTGMKPGTFVKLMNLSAQRSQKGDKPPATFINASGIIEEGRYDGMRVRQIGGETMLNYALTHGLIPKVIPPPNEEYKKNAAEHNDYMPVVPCMFLAFGAAYQEKMKAAGINFSLIENPQEPATFKYVSTVDTTKKNAVLRTTMHGKNVNGEDCEMFKLRMAYYAESFINFGVCELGNGFDILTKFFLPVLKDMDHVVFAQHDIKNTVKMEENSAQYLQMMLNAVSEDSDSDDEEDADAAKKMEAEKAEKAKQSYKFGHALHSLFVYFDYKTDLLDKFFIPVSHSYVAGEVSKGHIKNAMTAEVKKEADDIATHAFRETGAVVLNFTTDEAKKMIKKGAKKPKEGKESKIKFYAMSWTMVEKMSALGVKRFVEKFSNLTPEEGAGVFNWLVDRKEGTTPALKEAIVELQKTTLNENVLMESTIVLVGYKPQTSRCDPVKFLDMIYGLDSSAGAKKRTAEDAPPQEDAESEDKKQKTEEA